MTKKKNQSFSIETYRFDLSLEVPSDSKVGYPSFNWLALVDQRRESKLHAANEKGDHEFQSIPREFEANQLEELQEKRGFGIANYDFKVFKEYT